MRSLIGGLLGLCLSFAVMPQEAAARTDARSSAQSSTSARTTVAARPTATRATPPRHATVPRHATMPRHATSRATAAAPRQALAPRATTSGRTVLRAGQSRHAAAIPYSRQAALPNRGLRQTAVASCTTRNGRRSCAPAATRTVAMRWTGGLAPAAMSQAGCPDGTIATMAIGHSDITRCVPL